MDDARHEHVRTRSSRRRQRTVRALVPGLAALLSVWLGPATAAVADDPVPSPLPTPTAIDHLTVGAYDFASEVPAAVTQGSRVNNLRIDFTSGEPLVDGTIVVTLPRGEWPTDLHPAGGLAEDDPDLPGSFVVRPLAPDFPPGQGDCRASDAGPISVTVVNTRHEHVGIVQHLSCGMGDHVSVRIAAVRAPRSLGVHDVGVQVSDAAGPRESQTLSVEVVPRPSTRLQVEVPSRVQIYRTTSVVVRALQPDGRVDTNARGWVRLIGPDLDQCIFQAGAPVRVELTAADAGVKVVEVTFQVKGRERIFADSSEHLARPGRSNRFTIIGQTKTAVCSVSYH